MSFNKESATWGAKLYGCVKGMCQTYFHDRIVVWALVRKFLSLCLWILLGVSTSASPRFIYPATIHTYNTLCMCTQRSLPDLGGFRRRGQGRLGGNALHCIQPGATAACVAPFRCGRKGHEVQARTLRVERCAFLLSYTSTFAHVHVMQLRVSSRTFQIAQSFFARSACVGVDDNKTRTLLPSTCFHGKQCNLSLLEPKLQRKSYASFS